MKSREKVWSIGEVLDSFSRFKKENGHYPSKDEVDKAEYMIGYTSLKRKWGGINTILKMLGVDNEELKTTMRFHPHVKKWDVQEVKDGLERFYNEHGHYPSNREMNNTDYLPSCRYLERKYGGMENARKQLNLLHPTPSLHKGKIRSDMAAMMWKRATNYEEKFYSYLTTSIPELYIHEHKVLRYKEHKTDTDFFIYLPNSKEGIAIDLFYAADINSLLNQINIKLPKYQPLPHEIFFVSMNEEIKQEEINPRIINRKTPLPDNIQIYNVEYFNKNIFPTILERFNQILIHKQF